MQKGWMIAGDLDKCGAPLMTTMFAPGNSVKTTRKRWPWSAMYLLGPHYMRPQGTPGLPELVEFYRDWPASRCPRVCTDGAELRPMYSMDGSSRPWNVAFQQPGDKWQAEIANFFTSGPFHAEERD
jgi:hypothetical protein